MDIVSSISKIKSTMSRQTRRYETRVALKKGFASLDDYLASQLTNYVEAKTKPPKTFQFETLNHSYDNEVVNHEFPQHFI